MKSETDIEAEEILHQVASFANLGSMSKVSKFKTGVANHVYLIDQRFVIRIGTADDGPSFPKSIAVLKAIEGHVRAPKLIYHDVSRLHIPFNVLVYNFIPGVDLGKLWTGLSNSEKFNYVQGIGRELQSLHRFPIEKISHFRGKEDWASRFAAELQLLMELAHTKKAFSPSRLSVLRGAVEASIDSVFQAAPPAIVHNDLNWSNVIANNGKLAALIDFDDAEIAPPEEDYWALFRMLVEKGESSHVAMKWIAELSAGLTQQEGFRERCLLRQIYEMLWSGTTHYSWQTASGARADAENLYRDTFERKVFDKWFSELTPDFPPTSQRFNR